MREGFDNFVFKKDLEIKHRVSYGTICASLFFAEANVEFHSEKTNAQDLLTEVHLERVRRRREGHFSTQARDIPFLSFRENWGCLLEVRRR